LAVAIALALSERAYAASAGVVSALTGQVRIQRAGHPITVASGTPVEIGDQISTGPNSRVTITLSDGTQFELSDSTSMTVTQDQVGANGQRVETRLDLFGGLLHSLVRFAPGNAPNYEVHTPNAVAAARGTQYDTDYVNGVARKDHPGCSEFTDVAVFDGTVEVTNPKNKTAGSTTVTRGHKTTVPCGLLLGATAGTALSSTGSTTTGTAAGSTGTAAGSTGTAAGSTGAAAGTSGAAAGTTGAAVTSTGLATLSTTAIVTGAAVGTGVIAGGIVAGVSLSNSGSSGTKAPTPSPTPPITPSG
jgi:hypothetical protein